MATMALAEWAVALTSPSLPSHLPHIAVRCFYNWAGCVIGGSTHPTVLKAQRALSPFYGPPTAHILGHSQDKQSEDKTAVKMADAQHAALINGIASHVHDYDDTHLQTIIHPTAPVASALLAYAEMKGGVSGEAFILALVAGVEAECKLGLAVWPEHYDVGWHITSTTGSIGAAIAVSKLLSLTAHQTAHAIGIAATQVTGLREMFGSDTKSLHPGRAAQNGLLAALLAAEGTTSSLTALEAKRGWAACVSVKGAAGMLDERMGELGRGVWEVERNAFKPFPCGIVCHPAIDACMQLHHGELAATRDEGALRDTLLGVALKVHPLVLELTAKRTPRDGLEAKFSVFHGCAVALLYGKAGPAEYADEVVAREEVISVRDKIDAVVDEGLGLEADQCVAEVRLGGEGSPRILTKKISHALGSLTLPMSDAQLQRKFMDQCASILGDEGARKASDACWRLEEVEDMRELARIL